MWNLLHHFICLSRIITNPRICLIANLQPLRHSCLLHTGIFLILRISSFLYTTHHAQSLHKQYLYLCHNTISLCSLLLTPLVIPCLNRSHSNIKTCSSILLVPHFARLFNIPPLSVTLFGILDSAYANLSSFLCVPNNRIYSTYHLSCLYHIMRNSSTPQRYIRVLHDILLLAIMQSARHSRLNHTHLPTLPHQLLHELSLYILIFNRMQPSRKSCINNTHLSTTPHHSLVMLTQYYAHTIHEPSFYPCRSTISSDPVYGQSYVRHD